MAHSMSRRLLVVMSAIVYLEPAHSTNSSLRKSSFRPLARPPSGREAAPVARRLDDEAPPRLPTRDKADPEFFECETVTTGDKRNLGPRCGRHEAFYENKNTYTLNVTDKKRQCKGAMHEALTNGFGKFGVQECVSSFSSGIVYKGCKKGYCDMYEKITMDVSNGTNLYLGEDCGPLMNFNRTICEAYYRDAYGWCDCICPAMSFYEGTEDCKTSILGYLFFGKHGKPALQEYYLSKLCTTYFCQWVERIADPRNRAQGAPPGCLDVQLPFQRAQCENLLSQATAVRTTWKDWDPDKHGVYNPCPWDKASDTDFLLTCSDGYKCDVRSSTWACCQRHASRANCPKNFPVMCADPLECVGESDHCCVESEADCRSGVRGCSALMAPDLMEWNGFVPPTGPTFIQPTTTMSMKEWKLYLSRQPSPTTTPSSWGQDALPYMPYILTPLFLFFVGISFFSCYYFGGDTWKIFQTTLFGSRKWLTMYQMDVVHKFAPEDKPAEWDELPPRVTQADIIRREAENNANAELARACKDAFKLGRIHLVSVHFATGPGPQQEAIDIEEACIQVRRLRLENFGDNARLMEEGLEWADTVHAETNIVIALENAYPCLSAQADFKNLNKPPVPGAPWAATTVGHALSCDERRKVWAGVEELTQKVAEAERCRASHSLMDSARELQAELIARTHELPADRVVLCPDGQGVKLLPKGIQRNLWYHTGEAYLFDVEKEKANELNDFELPPSKDLIDTNVDANKPVCAHYAKNGKCKLGKRCPWRHKKPEKGDPIREPIMF